MPYFSDAGTNAQSGKGTCPRSSQAVSGQLGLAARQLVSLMCHLDNIALSAWDLTVTQLSNALPFLSHSHHSTSLAEVIWGTASS